MTAATRTPCDTCVMLFTLTREGAEGGGVGIQQACAPSEQNPMRMHALTSADLDWHAFPLVVGA